MRRAWTILIVLCSSLLITGLDNTITNVALPSIQRDLGASTAELQWVVDAYSVLFAGTLLLSGSLGDRFGRKRMLIIGLLIFGIGSVAAGFAHSGSELSMWRAVMGVGGAFVMPSTLSIIVQVFSDRRERARAIGVWAAVAGLGIALGPLIGGLLLEHFSWHSVFWVNPPLIMVVLIATALVVPESADPAKPRLDLVGAALWAAALISLVLTIIEVPESGLSATTALLALVTVMSLGAFIVWERRCARPILPLSLFTHRTFDVSVTMVALLYFALFGAMFFFPQFLQLVQGRTPLESGLAILPGALALVVGSVVSPRLAERWRSKPVVVFGLTLVVAGLLAASTLAADTPGWFLTASLVLMGLGMGLTIPHATSGVLTAVPPERAGMGSAVSETVGEVGGSLGVAVLGALLSASYRESIDRAIAAAGAALAPVPTDVVNEVRDSLAGASLAIPQLPPDLAIAASRVAGEAFVSGMTAALFVGAVVVSVGVGLAVAFFPRDLDQVDEA